MRLFLSFVYAHTSGILYSPAIEIASEDNYSRQNY